MAKTIVRVPGIDEPFRFERGTSKEEMKRQIDEKVRMARADELPTPISPESRPSLMDTLSLTPIQKKREEEIISQRETEREKARLTPEKYAEKGRIGRIGEQFQLGAEETGRAMDILLAGQKSGRRPSLKEMKVEEFPKPKGVIEKTARFAGELMEPIVPGAPPLTASPLALMMKAPRVVKTAQAFKMPVKKFAKQSTAFISEMLSSVPREYVEKALEKEAAGKSIFKGPKKSFESIGKKAQEAMNFVDNLAGKEVGAEKSALRGRKIDIPVTKYIDSIDEKIAERTIGELSELDKKDLKRLNEIKDLLMKGRLVDDEIVMDAAELNIIKKKMQQLSTYSPETVRKIGSEGQGIMKSVAREIQEEINEKIPELGAANEKFSKIRSIRNALQVNLKDKNVVRNVRNLATKDEFTKDLFKQLDDYAPEKLKFYDELQDTIIRHAFDETFPGRMGGSGSPSGFANLLRVGGTLTAQPLALPIISPRAHGAAIRGIGRGVRGAGPITESMLRGAKIAAPITKRIPKAVIGREELKREERR